MNHDPAAFEPRIADWLEGDPNAAPDQALQVVLAALPSIKQRRSTRPSWRLLPMSPLTRAATAVLVLAIVVGGAVLLIRPGGEGGPGGGADASPSPAGATPSAVPSVAPSASFPPTSSAAPSASADGTAFPVGAIPAGTYHTNTFARPPMTMTVGDGWSRKRDDKEVFALVRGELVVAFTHDATVGEVPPGSAKVTLGNLTAYEEIPPAPTGANPTMETGRNGGTIYIDEGLNPYDSRIGSVTAYWTLDLAGQPLKIKFNGPPSEVQSTLDEVRAILSTLEATP